MKKLLLLLLLSNYSFSQIIDKEEIDDFTKTKSITVCAFENKSLSLKDNISDTKDFSLYLYIVYTKEVSGIESQALILSFMFPKSRCIVNNDSKIMIMLENEQIIETKSIGRTDCGTSITTAFILEDLKPFTENNIKKLRIYTSEGYSDITIKESKKDLVKNTFALLENKINQ